MGQAKLRGTREQRAAQSVARRKVEEDLEKQRREVEAAHREEQRRRLLTDQEQARELAGRKESLFARPATLIALAHAGLLGGLRGRGAPLIVYQTKPKGESK